MLLRRRRRPKPPSPYVTVLETGDHASIALAKMRLDSAEIKYWVRDELVQDFFGIGRIGVARNFVVGPVRIAVNREDAEVAAELLSDIQRSRPRCWRAVRALAILSLAATVFMMIRDLFR